MHRYLALSALFCSVAAPQSMPVTVTVLLTGDNAPPAVLRAMQQETGSALAPSAISLKWIRSENLPAAGVEGELAILRLRGECRVGAAAVSGDVDGEKSVLGRTHIVNGRVLPFADILCDTVRQLVEHDLSVARWNSRDKLFGRALGRVAAHELYHILLHTTEHAHNGLSRPEQSSAELLADHESFEVQAEQRILDTVTGR